MRKSNAGEVFQESQFMNAVIRQSTDGDFAILHFHQGMEFLYIHEGTGVATIDRKPLPVGPGSLLYFQPFQLHKVEMTGNSDVRYVRSVFFINPVIAESLLAPFPELYAYFQRLLRNRLSDQAFRFATDGEIGRLIEQFRQDVVRVKKAHVQEEYMIFFLQLLNRLRKSSAPDERDSDETPARTQHHVEKMLEWLEHHFHETFSLQKLADFVFLSPYHASRLFKKHTGMSITDYVNVRRVKEASKLIATTQTPVKAIAAQVGFQSDAYFCKQFKHITGVSPSSYRQHLTYFHPHR
ncbi:AraC family transcriptional regulator [Paenibacillus sp. GYB003]|uniref:AraC family transcriptional regulator n=1 Tax=Paenibacillus sp. GYB003 TaxID=2994392 RepID=UPI002F96BEC9